MKKLTLLIISLLGIISFSKAQDLVVTLTNGNVESFPVGDIQSIKFGAEDMMLYELNGTTNTWNIDDIDNYAFDGQANVEESMNIAANNLKLYPNPSSDQVTINYSSTISGNIAISVFDMNGKQVENIYSGEHNTETEMVWNAKQNNPSGKYLIKITTENKILTKSVIIQ